MFATLIDTVVTQLKSDPETTLFREYFNLKSTMPAAQRTGPVVTAGYVASYGYYIMYIVILCPLPLLMHTHTCSGQMSTIAYISKHKLNNKVTAEEDLQIETSCPLNEATAVFMLKNLCYHLSSTCTCNHFIVQFML